MHVVLGGEGREKERKKKTSIEAVVFIKSCLDCSGVMDERKVSGNLMVTHADDVVRVLLGSRFVFKYDSNC